MNFGEVLELVKTGAKIARRGWGCKCMYVYYVPASNYKACTKTAEEEFGDVVPYEPYLAIKNVKGTISTWVPNIDDILADDWGIVK